MPLMSWWSYGTALFVFCLVGGAGYFFGGRRSPIPLPGTWRVEARPVLSAGERLAMSLLREALPHNVILAKLPLVRLCQPLDADRLRYWFDLIGPVYVSFAICSVNGRVLAVIDIEGGGPSSVRVARIKQGVLDACRIRYVRCRADRFPAPSELALLLRPQGPTARLAPLAPSAAAPAASALAPAPNFQRARGTLSDTVKTRRAERSARWADSSFAQDSFFGPNSRIDTAANSEFPPSAADETPAPQGQAAIR